MCKRKYEFETILDALNMANEIGATQTALKTGIPINTVNGWRRVKSMPEIYPNHIITRHFQGLGHSNPTITETYTTPDTIEIKAENNSASVELKVDVKPDTTKEIKGSYEQLHNNEIKILYIKIRCNLNFEATSYYCRNIICKLLLSKANKSEPA